MPLTYYDKTSNICKDCYKMLLYNAGDPDRPEEVFLDITYDDFGNIRRGMTQDDIEQYRKDIAAQANEEENYQPVIKSLEGLREADTAYPEDLLLISTELLPDSDAPGLSKPAAVQELNAYYANIRSAKAIKARDTAGNYFIKLVKPPLITKIELYKQTSNTARPTALIASFSYVAENGSYETGYFHPAVIRLDQSVEDGEPTEISFHEDMIHAHADSKKHIPFNLGDDDLIESDYYASGIFSPVANSSIEGEWTEDNHPDMNATVINGNLLMRDYQLFYLGTLFRFNDTHVNDSVPNSD